MKARLNRVRRNLHRSARADTRACSIPKTDVDGLRRTGEVDKKAESIEYLGNIPLRLSRHYTSPRRLRKKSFPQSIHYRGNWTPARRLAVQALNEINEVADVVVMVKKKRGRAANVMTSSLLGAVGLIVRASPSATAPRPGTHGVIDRYGYVGVVCAIYGVVQRDSGCMLKRLREGQRVSANEEGQCIRSRKPGNRRPSRHRCVTHAQPGWIAPTIGGRRRISDIRARGAAHRCGSPRLTKNGNRAGGERELSSLPKSGRGNQRRKSKEKGSFLE